MRWLSFRTVTALHTILKRVILCGLTPAEAQKPLANESWPHFANDCQVGLPRLSQHPAERCQEEEMQEGSSHSTEALVNKESNRERQGITTHGEVLFKQTNKQKVLKKRRHESSFRVWQGNMKPPQNRKYKGKNTEWKNTSSTWHCCVVDRYWPPHSSALLSQKT